MKAKLAFELLLLISVTGRASCPVVKNVTPVTMRTNTSIGCVKFSNYAAQKLTIDFDKIAPPCEEHHAEINFKSFSVPTNSPNNKIESNSPAVAVPIDLSHPESESSKYIIIPCQESIFVAFPHPPLLQRTIPAFIRNGILRV